MTTRTKMAVQKIDIGVACAPNQSPQWWTTVMQRLIEADRHPEIEIGSIISVATAVPDVSKNKVVTHGQPPASLEEKRRNSLTDSNRVSFTHGFLEGDADWLWQIDDDTVPPQDALLRLLKPQRPFIAGVYFLGGWPYNPVFYMRQPDGTYASFLNYPHQSMFEVDSVGMGCTLIHRSVFEQIKEAHVVYQRPNGSLIPVHKDQIRPDSPSKNGAEPEAYLQDGVLHLPLSERSEHDERPWPFYAMEYGRTEDHYFCELAASVGIKPYVDTSIVCGHYKLQNISREHHRQALTKMYEEGLLE